MTTACKCSGIFFSPNHVILYVFLFIYVHECVSEIDLTFSSDSVPVPTIPFEVILGLLGLQAK